VIQSSHHPRPLKLINISLAINQPLQAQVRKVVYSQSNAEPSSNPLEKEAIQILKEIETEKIAGEWAYRKGYRLMIIGADLSNDDFKRRGKEYLLKLRS
jgi:hypothetical protein